MERDGHESKYKKYDSIGRKNFQEDIDFDGASFSFCSDFLKWVLSEGSSN